MELSWAGAFARMSLYRSLELSCYTSNVSYMLSPYIATPLFSSLLKDVYLGSCLKFIALSEVYPFSMCITRLVFVYEDLTRMNTWTLESNEQPGKK